MKSYTRHYVLQRITACVLIVLAPWFIWILFCIKDLEYKEIVKNIGNPCSVTLLFFMLVSGFFHGYLGIQTICIDYISNAKMRSVFIFIVGAVFSFLSVFGTFFLVRLANLI